MDRRAFLRNSLATAAAVSLGPGFWRSLVSTPALAAGGPYGPLSTVPDANGLLLPAGFSSRVVARGRIPVGSTAFLRPDFPDGSGVLATDDGGWILVTNSENPPPFNENTVSGQRWGGASAIRFSAAGEIVDAYSVLTNTRSNCAGGVTPWDTWLSCEEFDIGPGQRGLVWECFPHEPGRPGVARPALGGFKHETAAVDPVLGHVYLTEDQKDGRFYRFTPDTTGADSLASGLLEAAVVDPFGAVTWIPVPDPAGASQHVRLQVPQAAVFPGGEGCWVSGSKVYISTKEDGRIHVFDIAAQSLSVLYDPAAVAAPVLRGVDNLIVGPTGDLLVAEDGGDMQVVIVTPAGEVAPLLQMVGPQHGTDGLVPGGQPDTNPLPHVASEVSGLAFSPDGTRLYCNSQRGFLFGITYEITGPFQS